MKTVFVAIIIAYGIAISSAYSSTDHRNSLKLREPSNYAIIHKLFEMIADLIKTGNKELDVPIWDPYQSNYTKIDISGKWYSTKANITHGTFSGLGDFYVAKSDFNTSDLSLDNKIIFPQLKFFADYYEMEGNLWEALPLTGRGRVQFEVDYITTSSKVYLKPSNDGKAILIDKIENPRFYIKKVISHTEFDKNFDDILNGMIADLLAGYLSRFNGLITNLYTETLIDYMNVILAKFETWQILSPIL